jgi:hypothetical protein
MLGRISDMILLLSIPNREIVLPRLEDRSKESVYLCLPLFLEAVISIYGHVEWLN